MNYNDIRKLILSTAKDRNNNGFLNEIMDLRTGVAVSNNHQQTSELHPGDVRSNKSVSMLLKKMLQAPKGANLVEIATPVSSKYSKFVSLCDL